MNAEISKAFTDGISEIGPSLINLVKTALTTFLPILVAVTVVWVGIRLYKRLTSQSGK